MSNQLSEKEILSQSRTAYAQWKDKWHSHAKINGEIYKKSGKTVTQLAYSGYGKQLIIVAMGLSLEDDIEKIKSAQTNPLIDIAVVDKGFKTLINHGIKPKYVFLADAGVSFNDWVGDSLPQTADVTLIANITSNPDWTTQWRGPVYFYVNRDNIGTQNIFAPISGCNEMIPASSNVGNSVIVFSVQYLGYDEHLLIGYDFSWNSDGNYYAFTDNNKRYWMKHLQGIGIDGKAIYTSSNLQFSQKWLMDYCTMSSRQGIQIYNCSKRGSFNWQNHDLEKRIKKFMPRPNNPEVEKSRLIAMANRIRLFGDDIGKGISEAMEKGKIVSLEIAYLPKGANV
jgi:hypothetical protein